MEKTKLLYTWTGHPLVDMGTSILVAFSDKENPEDLTEEDLEKFVKYAEKAYFTKEISGYLSILFTMCFLNPSFTEEKKKKYAGYILRAYKEKVSDDTLPCVYCKKPSVNLIFDNKKIIVARDLIPMMTGREMINFVAQGKVGLNVCGYCITAIQALSIGSPKCNGRSLIIHSENHQFVIDLLKQDEWLPRLRRTIQLSEASQNKLPSISRPKTRLIESIEKMRKDYGYIKNNVTVYHLSNSGQGPGIDIYHLPSSIIKFVIRAKSLKYADVWESICKYSWDKDESQVNDENRYTRSNYLYEDLFNLPEKSEQFIRRYFLKKAISNELRTWNITELFLKEVVGMMKARIEAIKVLGDKFAKEIVTNNDKSLWNKIFRIDKFAELRNVLITQSIKMLKSSKEPLASFDNFIEIFEEGDELARVDWKLAWDLVLIRVIDKLYEKKWFEDKKELLESNTNKEEN